MATQAIHPTVYMGLCSTSPGLFVAQDPLLFLLKSPESEVRFLLNLVLEWPAHSNTFCLFSCITFYFIWILYWYRWRSLIRIFFAMKYMKDPAFGYALGWTFSLFPAGSLTAFTLTGVRALRFLLDLDVSTSLMRFSIAPVAQNLYPLINLAFLRMVVEVELPVLFWMISSPNH